MRIELNEISDYEYINRKLREHAQELLNKAKKQKRPTRYLPKALAVIACDGGQTSNNTVN